MGETTKIGWTDATVNFWHGCTKVGPGCDHCYAEQFSKRMGHNIWGVGVPRRKIASAVKLIRKLNTTDREFCFGSRQARDGRLRRVFVQSMSDLFDVEVPLEWFAEAWREIVVADRLRIQIVTKRVSVIEKRLASIPNSFGVPAQWPKHAGLIITVVNQEEADRDVPRALALKAKLGIPWLGLSVEPQIGPIELEYDWLWPVNNGPDHPDSGECIDWIISGGESKQGKDHKPRHYDLAWARALRDQCAAAGIAYFQKQLGARPIQQLPMGADEPPFCLSERIALDDRQAGADPTEWPADLRVQQFPEALR